MYTRTPTYTQPRWTEQAKVGYPRSSPASERHLSSVHFTIKYFTDYFEATIHTTP